MSLRINKDNIFLILPESRYSVSERIDGYMDKSFTLFLSAKIFPDTMPINVEQFIFARNGMHSGFSVTKVEENKFIVNYSYWFVKTNSEGKYEYLCRQIYHELNQNEINEFNDYTMICESIEDKKIDCYFNKKLIGTIEFGEYDKLPYEQAFYWFGCGNLVGSNSDEHHNIGDFEYSMCFVLNKNITIEETYDFVENYEEKYTEIFFDKLRKIKDSYYLKENFAFFYDFKDYNRYKIWDLSFTGNYPQIYIENNIYF